MHYRQLNNDHKNYNLSASNTSHFRYTDRDLFTKPHRYTEKFNVYDTPIFYNENRSTQPKSQLKSIFCFTLI